MLDQSVNYFYRHLLFNIDKLPKENMFLLDVAATFLFFKYICSGVLGVRRSSDPCKTYHKNQPSGQPEASVGKRCGSGD